MAPDDPGCPGSVPFKTSPSPIPPIKKEPQDDAGLFQNTEQREVINLISDDEDETPTTANGRTLGSPFRSPIKKALPNLGSSLLSKPKTALPTQDASGDAHKLYRDKLLGKAQKGAKETAQRFRNNSHQVKRTRAPAQTDTDGIFITESRPGTPDPAEIFLTLQRDFITKRQRGILTMEEDIQFQRAREVEAARISKQDSDRAYDMSHEDEEADDMDEYSDLARLSALNDDPSDDQAESKKRAGLKRKTPTSAKPPKKRGKTTKDMTAEQLLEKAREKATAKNKTKGKGKGKGKAPVNKSAGASKRGRKARPADPDLLNTTNMTNTNVFEDTAHNQDLPNQPTFGPTFEPSTKKAKALKDTALSPKRTKNISTTLRRTSLVMVW
jgi:hypothetical protein